jgi:hypothetical protein
MGRVKEMSEWMRKSAERAEEAERSPPWSIQAGSEPMSQFFDPAGIAEVEDLSVERLSFQEVLMVPTLPI